MNSFLFARTGRGREPRVVRAVLSLTSAIRLRSYLADLQAKERLLAV